MTSVRAAEAEQEPERAGDPRGDLGQPLPLHRLRQHRQGRPARGREAAVGDRALPAMTHRRAASYVGRALAAALVLAAATPALAQQDYPTRPIRIITRRRRAARPICSRAPSAIHLGESLKQPVLVENRASASGVIAGELTANAPPDGYTLLPRVPPAHGERGAEPEAALSPGGQLHADHAAHHRRVDAGDQSVVAADDARGVRRLDEELQGAVELRLGRHRQRRPPRRRALQADDRRAGGRTSRTRAPGRRWSTCWPDGTSSTSPASWARSRWCAPGGCARSRSPRRRACRACPTCPRWPKRCPGTPVVGWYGVLGPAKLPAPIVARLHDELVRILNQPEVRERIVADGSEPVGTTPEDVPRVHDRRRRQVGEAGEGERGEAGLKRWQRTGEQAGKQASSKEGDGR